MATNVKVLDTLEDFEKFIKENNLVIVDFWATWCPPCVAIAPWFKEQAEKYSDIKFAKVDVDENSETSEKAEISCMPTFKVYYKGELLKTIEGADKDEISKIFELTGEGSEEKIQKMKDDMEKEKAEKQAMKDLEENVPMVTDMDSYNEFKKLETICCTNFYVEDYKESVTKLHKDICTAVSDESNTTVAKENVRRCDLNAHGVVGNGLKITSLPMVIFTKNDEELFRLSKESECTLENVEKHLKMSDDEIQAKQDADKAEKERLESLVPKLKEKKDYDEFKTNNLDKILVVDFFTTWCGPCIRFAPTFIEMADEYQKSGKNVVFAKIDCDENKEAKTEAGIKCFPTFKIYKGGEIVDTMEGASKAKLEEMIAKHLES